jgi:hypothetical protein
MLALFQLRAEDIYKVSLTSVTVIDMYMPLNMRQKISQRILVHFHGWNTVLVCHFILLSWTMIQNRWNRHSISLYMWSMTAHYESVQGLAHHI